MGLRIGYHVGLKETYPEDKPTSLRTYLEGIPKSTILLVGSSLLADTRMHSGNLTDVLSAWFRHSNNAFANDAYVRLKNVEQEKKQSLAIISQPSILKIFAFAYNKLGDEQSCSDDEIEIRLFKAFLYQNDLVNATETIAGQTTSSLPFELQLYALEFANLVRFSDIVNYDLGDLFFSEFTRAVFLFEFLEQRGDAKSLLIEFCKFYEVPSWKEYLKKVSSIGFLILRKEKEGHLNLTIGENDDFEATTKFLDKLALVRYDEIEDNDFKSLREKPILKLEKGVYRVISDLFAIEKISKGLYFGLKAVNETLPASQKVKDFRFTYTFHFSERHVLYQILDRTFPGGQIKISGTEIEKKGIKGATDFYVRNGNKMFLFESKDSLLPAALKESGDFTLLDKDLRKKFYQDGDDAKAVIQLLNFIKLIHSGTFHEADDSYKIGSIRIYPIVVIHDRQLDVMGFNKILNYWFQNELEKSKTELPISRINPITVIEISNLMLTHEAFRNKSLRLEEIIDRYHFSMKPKNRKQFRSEQEFEKHVLGTGLPFSNFLNHEHFKRKLRRLPRRLINDKAIIALEPGDG
jgi:hypothetical protein